MIPYFLGHYFQISSTTHNQHKMVWNDPHSPTEVEKKKKTHQKSPYNNLSEEIRGLRFSLNALGLFGLIYWFIVVC